MKDQMSGIIEVDQDADPPDPPSSERSLVVSNPGNQQVTLCRKPSPIKELHDLISYNIDVMEVEKEVRDFHKEDKEENIKQNKENILRQADVSPKRKSNNKGQKNANDKKIPLRVVPKKNAAKSNHVRTINHYRRRLGMCLANANCNGKIWYFVTDNIGVEVLMDSSQQITLKLSLQELNQHIITTLVYAKCDASERLELWEAIYHLSNTMTCSWLIGGDFNVVLNEEEKIGGNQIQPQDVEEFAFFINSCELEEVNFKGSPFTLWNGRADEECIFERLDRMLENSHLLDSFGNIEVEHLARTGSDHAPLLCTYGDNLQNHFRPFKFVSFWMETVRQNWSTWEHEDAFINFKCKMKKLKRVLSKWSREVFGDIFKQLIIREEIVRLKQQLFEENPSQLNRLVLQKAQAETKRYLHYEEEYWRQKSGLDWFIDGDKNTRFFHNLVKGRMKKPQIKRIQNSDGSWIEDEDQMAAEVVHFYAQKFSHEDSVGGEIFLSHIPILINQDRNDLLCQMPSVNEVKKAVFKLSESSASGPEVFLEFSTRLVGIFLAWMYTRWWWLSFKVILFLRLLLIPNLVLLPKKKLVQNCSDLRPISLSFVHGRSIIENVLLAQEIVIDIRKRGKPINIVIKLDMAKAYDRVSCSYLIKAKGFFHSTRGVKQGDPLSPKIVHLISRDDTIIFPSVEGESLKRIMKILQDYEAISGQLINKDKSAFYMYQKITGVLFYWSTKEERRSRHWTSWDKMKQTEVQWKSGSQVWKRMIEARDQAMPPDFHIDTSIEEVSYFMNAEGWDAQRLYDKLPINVCNHVLEELSIVEHSKEMDKA
ncbi:uncharacterized protein LOC132066528 [Lycium ferocissimum]|uniref:uncharacterized protein LOC132066528 n=1 Tax=Lycium ferocissimum TaxID=112874 RepID=UPI002815E41D|nr:uncharacterized protein LOC132066528 [Lycium ferocissimum]